MKNLISIFFIPILFTSQIAAQTVSKNLDDFFRSSENPIFFNGNVLVAENGKIIYQKSFGYADLAKKALNTENSTFQTASISKIFTSTAVLQLKDKGKLKLSDALVKYFSDFPYPNITVRHLLSHTSGLPDLELYQSIIDKNPNLIITGKDVIPALKLWSKPLKFAPGNKAEYCNTNFVLLALLVEKISNLSFQDYLKKNIFLPSQMNNTFVRSAGSAAHNPAVKNHVLPTMYKTNPEDIENLDLKDRVKMRRIKYETYNLGATLGDQNVISTTGDLLKFDEAVYSGKLLNPATVAEAFTPVKLNNGETYYGDIETAYANRCSFGLGWIVCDDPKLGKLVSHDGYNRGISTMFYRNISKRQTIIMFDNTEGDNFNEKVASVVNILNGKPALTITLKNSVARQFGETLLNKGIEAALVRFNEIRNDTNHYVLTERGINILGYDLLHNDYKVEAIEAFKLNVILFPDSFNVYDSYAQALAENGKKTEAIEMYKKAIRLNPKSEGSIKSLRQLEENK